MTQEIVAVPEAPQQDFIALSPAEMTTAHEGMSKWAAAKIHEMQAEVKELQDEEDLAKQHKWRSGGFTRHRKIAERRLLFYQKVLDALKAGYIVVPNFAMQAFAIRTTAKEPSGGWQTYTWSPNDREQSAQALPAGEGRYVNPIPHQETTAVADHDKDGKAITIRHARPDEFVDVMFPFAVAKPQIMAAAGQAMALKVFDEIGMTEEWHRARRGDPIVLGRLLNPRPNAPSVTFFIGWYMDTRRI